MRRGTTPTITATITGMSDSLADMSELWLTLRQGNVIINKTKSQCTVGTNTIEVTLTQTETLSLTDKASERGPVFIQVRGLTTTGKAWASDITAVEVGAILKDGAIS